MGGLPYENNIYIKGLIDNLESILVKSPYWAAYLFNRIFNNEECLLVFWNLKSDRPKNLLLSLSNEIQKYFLDQHKDILRILPNS